MAESRHLQVIAVAVGGGALMWTEKDSIEYNFSLRWSSHYFLILSHSSASFGVLINSYRESLLCSKVLAPFYTKAKG